MNLEVGGGLYTLLPSVTDHYFTPAPEAAALRSVLLSRGAAVTSRGLVTTQQLTSGSLAPGSGRTFLYVPNLLEAEVASVASCQFSLSTMLSASLRNNRFQQNI